MQHVSGCNDCCFCHFQKFMSEDNLMYQYVAVLVDHVTKLMDSCLFMMMEILELFTLHTCILNIGVGDWLD